MSNDNLYTNPCDPCNPCGQDDCCQEPTCEVPNYDNTGCLYPQGSECITHNQDIPCLGYKKDTDNLFTLLTKLVAYVLTIFSRVSSKSLKVTRKGTCQDNLEIELVPSVQSGNILTIGSDGLPYVPGSDVVIHDSQCISWQKTIVGNVIHYVPTLDMECIAAQVCAICAQTAPCDTPAGLGVTSTLVENNSVITAEVNATWTVVPGVVYNIQITGQPVVTGVTSPHLFTGLQPNTTYTVTVVAECPQGTSSQTSIVVTTPNVQACGGATNFIVT